MGKWPWELFKPEEVLSPEGMTMFERGTLLVQPILLDTLTAFRAKLSKPILINHGSLKYRGYRSPQENYKIVKGETYSFHMQGLAADCTVPGMTPEELAKAANQFGWHGIGCYPASGFCHLDMRPLLDGKPINWTK